MAFKIKPSGPRVDYHGQMERISSDHRVHYVDPPRLDDSDIMIMLKTGYAFSHDECDVCRFVKSWNEAKALLPCIRKVGP